MKKTYPILVILIIFLASITVIAADIDISYGSLDGYTTYIIEEENNYKSKLDFPLNVNIVKMRIENDQFELNFGSSFSRKYAGTFYDTDWYKIKGDEESIYDTWDIYSESKAELKAYYIDCNLSLLHKVKKNRDFKVNIGYKYQNYDFIIHDVTQWGSFYDREDIFTNPGNVLDYEVNYHIPYLGMEFKESKEKHSASLSFSYSPIVTVNDRDDHLLRNKLSKIEASGRAINIGSEYTYSLKKNITLLVNLNFTDIYTAGKQVQKDYHENILFEDIDSVIKSQQLLFATGIKILF